MVMPQQKLAWGININRYEDAQHLVEQLKQGTHGQVSYQQLVDELLTDYSKNGWWRDYREQAIQAKQAFDNAFTGSEVDDCNQQAVQGLKKLFESLNHQFQDKPIKPSSRLFAYLDVIADQAKNRGLINSYPLQGTTCTNNANQTGNEVQQDNLSSQAGVPLQLQLDTEQQMGRFYKNTIKPDQPVAVRVSRVSQTMFNQHRDEEPLDPVDNCEENPSNPDEGPNEGGTPRRDSTISL